MNSKKLFVKIQYILDLLFIVLSATPILLRNYSRVIIMLMILWGISAFLILLTGKKIKHIKLFLMNTIWIIWFFFLFAIGHSKAPIGSYFYVVVFYFYIYVMIFADTYFSEKMLHYMVVFTVIVIVANLVDNIYLCAVNEHASTLVMTNIKIGSYYKTLNIGATNFSAMIYLFASIALVYFFHVKKNIEKAVFAIIIVLSIYLISFQHARATSSFLLLLTIFFIMYSQIVSKYHISRSQRILLVTFFFLLGYALLVPSLNLMDTILDNDRMHARIDAVITVLQGNVNVSLETNTLERRFYLIHATFDTFFSNIRNLLFGVGYDLVPTNSIQEMITTMGVGYHSELFDVFGCYGLVGAYFVYGIIFGYRKILKRKFNSKNCVAFNYVYWGFILFSFMNIAFCPEIGLIVFVLLPFAPYLDLKQFNVEGI